MFVAISRFAVANGMEGEVKDAFAARPHRVDAAPGFVRLDVISPVDNPAEIWLVTYWQDEARYREWHKSHEYQDSHKGIPKGLKLVPRLTELRFFNHICS
jgi:heme-degrading monooxygenase HmoA